MSFWLYSNNFFSRSPYSHLAVSLRGEMHFSGGVPFLLEGRGITIGHTHLINPRVHPSGYSFGGCQSYANVADGARPGQSQIEIFYPYGYQGFENLVFSDTCAPLSGLLDGVWYKYYIHANDNGWVAFWIEDLWGNEIDQGYYPAVQVPFYFSDNGNTEIWIAAPIAGSTGPWSVIFYDIQHGWF